MYYSGLPTNGKQVFVFSKKWNCHKNSSQKMKLFQNWNLAKKLNCSKKWNLANKWNCSKEWNLANKWNLAKKLNCSKKWNLAKKWKCKEHMASKYPLNVPLKWVILRPTV